MIDPTGIDLSKFLTNWYGPRSEPQALLGAECDWLPDPLREWHALTSQWSNPVVDAIRMIPPREISVVDGKAVFMTDSSRDWLWSFDAQNTSLVYDAQLHMPWEACQEALQELLIHATIREGVINARSFRLCPQVEERWISRILATATEVSFGGWRWPAHGYRTFMSSSLIITIGPARNSREPFAPRSGFWSVQAGSNEPARLAYLDELDIKWMK